MKVQRCSQGHFYHADKYAACPYCKDGLAGISSAEHQVHAESDDPFSGSGYSTCRWSDGSVCSCCQVRGAHSDPILLIKLNAESQNKSEVKATQQLFCLIIHHPLRSAWGTQWECDPDYAKVLFCDRIQLNKEMLICDEGSSLPLLIKGIEDSNVSCRTREMLTIDERREFTVRLDEPLKLDEPIRDAMEGWTLVFSGKSIEPEDYLGGYRRIEHLPGLYINTKHEEERAKGGIARFDLGAGRGVKDDVGDTIADAPPNTSFKAADDEHKPESGSPS